MSRLREETAESLVTGKKPLVGHPKLLGGRNKACIMDSAGLYFRFFGILLGLETIVLST